MGNNTSKKKSTPFSAFGPKIQPTTRNTSLSKPITTTSASIRSDRTSSNSLFHIQSYDIWNRDYHVEKTKPSHMDLLQARIAENAEEHRRNNELEKRQVQLRREREYAITRLYTRPKPVITNPPIEALISIENRWQIAKECDQKYFPLKKGLPELTPKMLERIKKVSEPYPSDELLIEIDGVQILRKDISTLLGLNWLNDEIINAYMTLLTRRGKKDGYKSVHSFNTFFYPKLRESGYNSVRRWTRKIDVFNQDYIIVPVHLGNHWTLVFIDFAQKTISYYDSLGGSQDGYCDTLLDYLRNEMSDKKKQEFDDSGWKMINRYSEGIPVQQNCSDCGVFTCVYAEHLTRGADLEFSQKDMPYFRKRMIYEIVTQDILE